MAELNLMDGLLSGDSIDKLFDSDVDYIPIGDSKEETTTEDNKEVTVENKETKDNDDTGEGYIAIDDNSESVASGEDNNTDNLGNASPNNIFSIAKALVDDGVLEATEDDLKEVQTASDFVKLIDKQVESRFNELQKRINDALNNGVEPSLIQRYEGIIKQLNSYDDAITQENQQSEDLRRKIIYTDYINKGFSESRAQRETDKSFNSGNDIEDAKEALQSLKDQYKDEYDDLRKEAENQNKERQESIRKQGEDLKKLILEDKNLFELFEVNNNLRQKVYENISKPIFKDENGLYLTAIQKYQRENYNDFLAKVSLFYTLTDGFQNTGKILNLKVKNEVNKSLKNIEKTLNNTARTSNGNLNFTSGVNDSQSSLRLML